MREMMTCSLCGAKLEPDIHYGKWMCKACGAFKEDDISGELENSLLDAGMQMRLAHFREAESRYEEIIRNHPKCSRAYWGRVLSYYGIVYEIMDDGAIHPTCYKGKLASLAGNDDYTNALHYASDDERRYYKEQAKEIDRLRDVWREIPKDWSFDVFLSYKDSSIPDRTAAEKIYKELTGRGYKVFFSRESLKSIVGQEYEPYILQAINTAQVMLVYSSSADYVNSRWIHNEWSRYLSRIGESENGKKNGSLTVIYSGFSPESLPVELRDKQHINRNSNTFYNELINYINRFVSPTNSDNDPYSEQSSFTLNAIPYSLIHPRSSYMPNTSPHSTQQPRQLFDWTAYWENKAEKLAAKNTEASLIRAIELCKHQKLDYSLQQKYWKKLEILRYEKAQQKELIQKITHILVDIVIPIIPIVLLALSFFLPFILVRTVSNSYDWYFYWSGATIASLILLWITSCLILKAEIENSALWILSIITIAYNVIFVLPFQYIKHDYYGNGWIIALVISISVIIAMIIAYIMCYDDFDEDVFINYLYYLLGSSGLFALLNIITSIGTFMNSWTQYMWKGFAFILASLAGIPTGLLRMLLMIFGSGFWWSELYGGVLPWLTSAEWNLIFYGVAFGGTLIGLGFMWLYSSLTDWFG